MYSSTTTRRSSSMDLLTTTAYVAGIGIGVPLVAAFVTPLMLGTLTVVRQHWQQRRRRRRRKQGNDMAVPMNDKDEAQPRLLQSTLLTGRVWHTRFHPVRHAFTYPLFMFGMELDEQEEFNERLWPLSMIMKFSTRHHLCNGEGSGGGSSNNDNDDDDKILLRDRIFALVQERTGGYLQPTTDTHRVWLVTHLEYYGYCFNPVSFYYVMNRQTGRMQVIVAEVFNTPWIEMYAYVLHPTSAVDKVKYSRRGNDDEKDDIVTNFKFPKTFHVSPFMEMDYLYDWTFAGQDKVSTPAATVDNDTLRVTTSMLRLQDGQQQFTATMRLQRAGLHPWRLAWQLALYPSFCLTVQLWIHVQAFWLFWRNVPYQPHPTGAETAASRMIGAVMTPLFAVQEWFQMERKTTD